MGNETTTTSGYGVEYRIAGWPFQRGRRASSGCAGCQWSAGAVRGV